MLLTWFVANADVAWQAWRLAGDIFATKAGDKPWISEMYGYSFGAAKADVWHRYDSTAMLYPSYFSSGWYMVVF